MTEEQIKDEARKAANRSQFMSNWQYDHKSYEDGFCEGAAAVAAERRRVEDWLYGNIPSDDADHICKELFEKIEQLNQ